jgi:hypothetical protein
MKNAILFKAAKPYKDAYQGEVLVVPFTCEDAGDMHLHEPSINRTEAENAMANIIAKRLIKALAAHGYTMVGLSFSSWTVTVKPTNPVN